MFFLLLILFICFTLNSQIKEYNIKNDLLLRYEELSNYLFNEKIIVRNKNDIKFFLDFEHNQLDNISNSSKYSNNTDNSTNNSNNSNIYIHGEIIFVRYYLLSFIGLFFGFIIILYGSYYYMLGLTINFGLFLYYFLILIIDTIKDSKRNYDKDNNNLPNYLYLYAFSFSSGILLCIFIYEKEKIKIQYKVIKILYGCILGFFLFKTISYYYYCFNGKIINNKFYYLFVFLLVFIGAIVNFCLSKFEFLPCSIISGSYFIITSISYILGQYYSDIINITDSKKEKKDFTLFIIHIFLIIGSLIHQINYYKMKILENPFLSQRMTFNESDNLIPENRESINGQEEQEEQEYEENPDQEPNDKEENQEKLVNDQPQNKEEDDDDINDQED